MRFFDLLRNIRTTFALLSAITYFNIVLFIFSLCVLVYHFIKLENLNMHFQQVRASLPPSATASLEHALRQFEWSHTFLLIVVFLLFVFSVILPVVLMLFLGFWIRSIYAQVSEKIKLSAQLISRPLEGRPILTQMIEILLGLIEIWLDSRGGWSRLVAPFLQAFRFEFERSTRSTAKGSESNSKE